MVVEAKRVQFGRFGGKGRREKRGDQQANQAVGQVIEDERDEDVIGVVGFFVRVDDAGRLLANRIDLFAGGRGRVAGRRLGLRIVRDAGRRSSLASSCRCSSWAAVNCASIAASSGAVAVLGLPLPGDLVEVHRRRLELVKHEQQHAQRQDEQLHGDFEHGVEHQAQSAFAERRAAQVALHLRLIGAEIGQHQKRGAQHARPERVAVFEVERVIDGLQFVETAGQAERVGNVRSAGSFDQSTTTAEIMPAKITAICCFCVTFTASLPPKAV